MMTVRGDKNARSQQIRLGRALSRSRDRVFDGRQVRAGKINRGSATYELVRAASDSAGP